MRVLDLFSGIGGFSLGLEMASPEFETVAFCEQDGFCQKVLKKHWPDVPIYDDVRTLDATGLGRIDLICGGYPCQPFSTASARRRVAEDLWPAMLSSIEAIKPRVVIAENVNKDAQGIALADLERLGYRGFRECVGTDRAGAPHRRNRWWVCAYTDHKSKLHSAFNAKMAELPELCRGLWSWPNYSRAIRVSHGLPTGVDRPKRLKALGNAVVPQVVQRIGEAIIQAHKEQAHE